MPDPHRDCKLHIHARLQAFFEAHAGHPLEFNADARPYEPYLVRCTTCHDILTVSVTLGSAESEKVM